MTISLFNHCLPKHNLYKQPRKGSSIWEDHLVIRTSQRLSRNGKRILTGSREAPSIRTATALFQTALLSQMRMSASFARCSRSCRKLARTDSLAWNKSRIIYSSLKWFLNSSVFDFIFFSSDSAATTSS